VCPHLFVYGTLRRGFDNLFARKLSEQADFIEPATVGGRIYALTPDYPGLVLSEDPKDRARGEVFRMHDPTALLPLLDDYEGCGPLSPKPYEFERTLATAVLDRARQIEVWVYAYRRPVDENTLII
jgi:gamma-glutamylcyclotransferase (GGCT)/AIG2-like uncharacterized protein YtfP